MTKLTYLPGFEDSVHDAQQTFRSLLDANARPGTPYPITANMSVPLGLTAACAAACLTLLDLDVRVWLQPSFASTVRDWLLFHTGCCFTLQPGEADFALIGDLAALPELSNFRWGTAEQPEASTTLLIQVESWEGGQRATLTGPGILDRKEIAPNLPCHFWDFWVKNHQAYPQGVDVFLFTENAVMGLPRTAKSEVCYER
ncbi:MULTISPECIES: phosphonate C-P lyase system protein PhnH [Nostoc]|uniref:Phosphonate C-P lyase system protein PhnH n=1 Tax=Nostoc paludosum FACHB-159 TaxID=2692908 RepID=A0ABR8K3X3_9NOSO|nr:MULTISPECIES: phosphonate C-P lyase system protein PhnH [Nostoc]MBD2677186.1 phosphonate C-P lyase system protein PhnH [Nostoc sp. FACHB-857]MBD2733005.1 phosphonate C-P lyase system protein PhnH [Nostoc paludosum FACHB-159]